MKNWLERALDASSEIEFLHCVASIYGVGLSTELRFAHDEQYGYGIKLEISQNVTYRADGKLQGWRGITYRYTLYENNILQWEILGQATITGLKDIQAAFRQMRTGDFTPRLEAGIVNLSNQAHPPASGSLEALAIANMVAEPTLRLDLPAFKTRSTKGGQREHAEAGDNPSNW